MPQQDFKNILKYGKCGGRKQLHNARIHPYYCVNENAGTELHGCADIDTYFISKNHKCNCCEECSDVCKLAAKVRTQDTVKDMYEQWKDLLKKHD